MSNKMRFRVGWIDCILFASSSDCMTGAFEAPQVKLKFAPDLVIQVQLRKHR